MSLDDTSPAADAPIGRRAFFGGQGSWLLENGFLDAEFPKVMQDAFHPLFQILVRPGPDRRRLGHGVPPFRTLVHIVALLGYNINYA